MWRQNPGQETVDRPFQRDGARSRPQSEEKNYKESSKKAEEIQGVCKLQFREFVNGFSPGNGGGNLGRQVQDSKDLGIGPGSLDGRCDPKHETVCPPVGRFNMGDGRGRTPAHNEPIRQNAFGSERRRRTPPRSCDAEPYRRPSPPRPSLRSSGWGFSETEKPRADHGRSGLGYSPKSGSDAHFRGFNIEPCRGSSSTEGVATRLPVKGRYEPLGEGARQGEVQGQGERKKRQRERKGKRRRKENLLRVGERKKIMKAFKEDAALRNGEKGSCKRSGEKKSEDGTKWEAKPEKKECSGSKEKTAVVHEKFALEKLTEGEASPLPSKLFHHREGVAATTPASQSCTDLYPGEALGDEVEGDLGLGRVVAEKERLPPGDALVGMGDIGIWLQGRIDGLLFLLCRVKPSGKIFPLPSSLSTLGALFPLEPDPVMSWLRCLVLSLNSLNGEGLEMSNPPTEFHKKILSGLIEDCRRIVGMGR